MAYITECIEHSISKLKINKKYYVKNVIFSFVLLDLLANLKSLFTLAKEPFVLPVHEHRGR